MLPKLASQPWRDEEKDATTVYVILTQCKIHDNFQDMKVIIKEVCVNFKKVTMQNVTCEWIPE